MTDDEILFWLVLGAGVFLFLAAKKPASSSAPGATTLPGIPGTGATNQPPSILGTGAGNPVCMTDAGTIVPMNPDGSCPAGSTLTIAVDVVS